MSLLGNILNKLFPHRQNQYSILVKRSIEELKIKTSAYDRMFQLGKADWKADLQKGIIEFISSDGIRALCSLQIIGTYVLENHSWLWSWANSSIIHSLQTHSILVKNYGETNAIRILTTPRIQCEESQAWEFVAIACKLGNSQGAYRGPHEGTFVFMTFDNVQLNKPEK